MTRINKEVDTRIIIMADGHSSRWVRPFLGELEKRLTVDRGSTALKPRRLFNAFRSATKNKLTRFGLPHSKHLLTVGGETLLYRQVRLAKKHGADEVYIASSFPEHETLGAHRYTPTNNIYEIDRFLCSSELWNNEGTTTYLYGDVYYSENAIRMILNAKTNEAIFFGRAPCSDDQYAFNNELYALKFAPDFHEELAKHIYHVRNAFINGQINRCIGWDLLRSLTGTLHSDINETKHLLYQQIISINDETTDFDTAPEYRTFLLKTGLKP